MQRGSREVLSQSRLAEDLNTTPVHLRNFAEMWEAKSYAPGDYLYQAGDTPPYVFLLCAGQVLAPAPFRSSDHFQCCCNGV